MSTVTVSPKFQVVIPREVRESLQLKPGQELEVIEYDGLLHFIPLRPIHEYRGSLEGIDTTIERDEDRIL